MSDAQTWAALGIFAVIGVLVTVQTTLVLRLIDAKFDGLRAELTVRFDAIDRDLQRLYEHVFQREEPRG
jgi:hypothetical protein